MGEDAGCEQSGATDLRTIGAAAFDAAGTRGSRPAAKKQSWLLRRRTFSIYGPQKQKGLYDLAEFCAAPTIFGPPRKAMRQGCDQGCRASCIKTRRMAPCTVCHGQPLEQQGSQNSAVPHEARPHPFRRRGSCQCAVHFQTACRRRVPVSRSTVPSRSFSKMRLGVASARAA